MNQFKLAILVPTRGRPHNLKRLAAAAKETCVSDYTIFARVDDDDTSKYPKLDNVEYVVGPRIFFSKSVNEVADIASERGYSHLAILGDDVVPSTKGWDATLMNAVPDMGVAYGSDGLENLHGSDLPTHVVVPTKMYDILGWIALPTLRHLFCDNVWRELGKMTDFVYFPDIKLTHLHRWNKTAPDDKTYQEANDKEKRQLDKLAFELWRDGFGLLEARKALTGK